MAKLKLLIHCPTYKVINDVMWDVIIHCNNQNIKYKLNWADIWIKTKNAKMQFCLDKEAKKIIKSRQLDAVFNSEQVKELLRYISEVEKWLKCDLKGRRWFEKG